ncbi:DUF1284 domain-containing protein [Primorskyibacter aestuariivivens]|uniref:DUF1284 domain-containing protein n=1 Tax=Primorskyibacter aestuariivivens TaxID=1888912 RepID=UPI002300C442|nr:DUF1284 domain-containing protein [Primorskyibacter aestuariivivens]MDA7428789.1 DUF1284 domain-containing protein [Primorskyibacter aestuariivivens]
MIRFRPHHFLCALGFQGKGYSDSFTANMARLVQGTLRAPGGDATLIEVIGATDDICAPCPKRRGTLCTAQDKIARLDAAHAQALGLQPGDRLTWGTAQARMKSLPADIHDQICTGCEWKELGFCAAALHVLQS